MTADKLTRIRNGKREVLCGGYVGWDTRKKNDFGSPIRTSIEVRVWMPAGKDYSDCGYWTEALVKSIETKIIAKGKKNVECRESWQY